MKQIEELRSLEQELTFNSCTKIFGEYELDFSQEKFNILGICNHALSENREELIANVGNGFKSKCATGNAIQNDTNGTGKTQARW